jgi:hypothetical protein
MEFEVVKDAVEQLELRGIPLTQVTSVMVREVTGFGSFSTITQHLRALRGEASADDEATDGSSANATTALATIADEDEAIDAVQAAEGALRRAHERVAALEAEVPVAEDLVGELREQVLMRAHEHMVTAYAASRGLLPSADVGPVEQAMWESGRRLRTVRERLEAYPAALAQAQAAVRVARQQLFLAEQHPELMQSLTEAEGLRPTEDRGPDSYREWAIWRQQVAAVRARVDDVIAQAGL